MPVEIPIRILLWSSASARPSVRRDGPRGRRVAVSPKTNGCCFARRKYLCGDLRETHDIHEGGRDEGAVETAGATVDRIGDRPFQTKGLFKRN